uniref:Uncharacterized protein n=1 Tax=Anguilla anguilla TaxID=7936 RepID=A0A0E9S6Y4_ANGAN
MLSVHPWTPRFSVLHDLLNEK